MKKRSVFDMPAKSTLKTIREEPQTFSKKAELFRASMMTPDDRVQGNYEYNILTCSYRPKDI